MMRYSSINVNCTTRGSIIAVVTTMMMMMIVTLTTAFTVPKQQLLKPLYNNNNLQQHHYARSIRTPTTTTTTRMVFDPSFVSDMIGSVTTTTSTITIDSNTLLNSISSSNIVLSFSDQGQNLAGIFFQLSLIPYLLFLYFLSYRGNRINTLSNFGFQYVLVFVLATIPSGIISKSIYGFSLADTDWLHGGAEALLTTANILIVLGLKEAMTKEEPRQSIYNKGRLIALGVASIFGLSLVVGPALFGSNGHTPFLFGIGNIPSTIVEQNLNWIIHIEPINALSIPTWMIHFSSVYEYIFAMGLIWQYSIATKNSTWKGLTWGMLPLHASGICACTYHFFYNNPELQFLVSTQAGLTLLGNITCMVAAYRIAISNGWNFFNEIPFTSKSSTSATGLLADGLAAQPLVTSVDAVDTTQSLLLKLTTLTIVTSYIVKYGELGIDLPFTPNAPVAIGMVLGFPGLLALQYYLKSQQPNDDTYPTKSANILSNLKLPSFSGGDGEGNKASLSMSDVKKYGIAGTVAYVLTELAFWIVAFPVAGTALYQSTGHWPDVINDTTDRAAVVAFIFAGANIARAFVPIRFGAALALAPWVDTNIIARISSLQSNTSQKSTTTSDNTVIDVIPVETRSTEKSKR